MKVFQAVALSVVIAFILATVSSGPDRYGENKAIIYHGWPFAIDEVRRDGVDGPKVLVNEWPENAVLNFIFYFITTLCAVKLIVVAYKKL